MASLGTVTVQIDAKEVVKAIEHSMRALRGMQVAARPASSVVALPALAAAACAKSGRLRLSRRSFLFPFRANGGGK